MQARGVFTGEYLYQYREVALPLLGAEWELAYFVLDTTTMPTTIKRYRTAKDLVFNPSEEVSIMVGRV